jgi:hypothetical protein
MKKVTFLTLFLFSFSGLFLPSVANADNANPPKIIDLLQVTKGPYKPGDLVTFKVVYTGGNPGVDNIQIIFANGCDNKFQLRWYESEGVTDKHGNGVLSSAIPLCPPGFIYPTYVKIMDKTQLEDSKVLEKLANLAIEINDYIYKPIPRGEIAPNVFQTHTLDLTMIPSNPKIGDSYLLPAVTSVGMPAIYRVSTTSPCSVTQDQVGAYGSGLPGGVLKINRNGECNISIQSFNGSEIGYRPSFDGPTINTKGRLNAINSTSVVVSYEIKVEAKAAAEQVDKQDAEVKVSALKKKTITCIKGKVTKKVTAVNPKCPAGYKKK